MRGVEQGARVGAALHEALALGAPAEVLVRGHAGCNT